MRNRTKNRRYSDCRTMSYNLILPNIEAIAIATQNIKHQVKGLPIKDIFKENDNTLNSRITEQLENYISKQKVQYSKMSTGQKIIYDFKMQFQ